MRFYLTYFLLICNTLVIAQTSVVKGKIVNTKGKGIAFATLLSLTDQKTGTVAQEDGSFTLLVASAPVGHKIVVSVLGFADTTLTLKKEDFTKTMTIQLRERPLLLSEVTVKRAASPNFLLGNPQVELLKYPDGKYYFLKANQSGAGVGTVFSTKKRKGIIETISIFMGETQPTTYIMTLFALNDLGEDYRLYPQQQLIPIINQPIVFTTNKIGWIDIGPLSVTLPTNYLVVLVTKVNPNSTQETATGKTYFEYRIGRQFSKKMAARNIYLFGNQYAVLAKNDEITAIYVTCYE